MKRPWFIVAAVASLLCHVLTLFETPPLRAQEPTVTDSGRAGQNFIPTPVSALEADLAILKLYDGLHVAEVFDGMDKAGLQGVGAVDPAIHALWKDPKPRY